MVSVLTTDQKLGIRVLPGVLLKTPRKRSFGISGTLRSVDCRGVGAILGSFIYKQFLIGVLKLGLPSFTLDLNQVVIALIGAVLFLFILSLISRRR